MRKLVAILVLVLTTALVASSALAAPGGNSKKDHGFTTNGPIIRGGGW